MALVGNYDKAVEETREALRLEPNAQLGTAIWVWTTSRLNRLDDAEAVVKQAEERHLESEGSYRRYQLAFLKNDVAGMARVVRQPPANRDWRTCSSGHRATPRPGMGGGKGRELTRRAVDLAVRNELRRPRPPTKQRRPCARPPSAISPKPEARPARH